MTRGTHDAPSLPAHRPPSSSLARSLLIATAAGLAALFAAAVSIAVGTVEMLVLVALGLLLWPIIVSGVRDRKPGSAANQTTLREKAAPSEAKP